VLYVNDGDWVESCTAVVERRDGALQIVSWTDSAAVAYLPANRASADSKAAA